MSRINSSRQAIAAKQRDCNYHPSYAVAKHIADTTVYDESITEEVVVRDGQYLVASSKFAHRFYIVAEQDDTKVCSSRDQAVAARCIAKVQTYLESLKEVA